MTLGWDLVSHPAFPWSVLVQENVRRTIGPVTMTFTDHVFKRCHCDGLIATLRARWCVSYEPSYQDLPEMMKEVCLP